MVYHDDYTPVPPGANLAMTMIETGGGEVLEFDEVMEACGIQSEYLPEAMYAESDANTESPLMAKEIGIS